MWVTQVLPATSSDLASMDREFISAQRERAFMSSPQQGLATPDTMTRSKPASLLSMDNGSAAADAGSFASYQKLQGMQSFTDSVKMQRAGDSGMGTWSQNSNAAAQNIALGQSMGNRHTHDE